MSHQKISLSKNNENKPVVDQAFLEHFVKTQQQKLLNEAEEIKLKGREIELHSKYAEKALDHQAKHLASKPVEQRKTITRVALIIGALVLIFMGFIALCLYMGKDEFILQFLHIASYFLTTLIGYYFGKQGHRKGEQSDNNKVQEF